jgi:hypothetical protein
LRGRRRCSDERGKKMEGVFRKKAEGKMRKDAVGRGAAVPAEAT